MKIGGGVLRGLHRPGNRIKTSRCNSERMEDEVYSSSVLDHLERLGEPCPSDTIACTKCPIAMWYWPGEDALVCFCSALHRETWSDTWKRLPTAPHAPVLFCDGQVQALARLSIKSAPTTN